MRSVMWAMGFSGICHDARVLRHSLRVPGDGSRIAAHMDARMDKPSLYKDEEGTRYHKYPQGQSFSF